MKRFLLFAGTTEGRILAGKAAEFGIPATVCVATEYGRELLLQEQEHITIHTGRMDEGQMQAFMEEGNYFAVVDATHPYAVEVTKNIKSACKNAGVRYLRLLREESVVAGITYADSLLEAVQMAKEGNILATTGSKEILPYTRVKDFSNRVYLRILPCDDAIAKCVETGFRKENIIAQKGPFTIEENIEAIKKYQIQTLITKDGGKEGGFFAKTDAAKACGIAVIVVKRPKQEQGYSLEEIEQILKEG